jgi:glycosyltransferase involved in cell wall biosynthesis
MSRLARSLADCGADVEVLSLNPRKHRTAASGPVSVHAVDIDTSRVFIPALRALSGEMTYLVARFVSSKFCEALKETLLRFNPDVVQIESPFLLPYASCVREVSDARVVLRAHNVEFRIWESLSRTAPAPLRRFALRRIASALRTYELKQMETLDAIVPISCRDAEDFQSLGCTRPMHVVPCGVADSFHRNGMGEPEHIGFIGSLDFRPNQEAAAWILDELWPRVHERAPRARLSIAGTSPPRWLRRQAERRGVDLHADVADADAFMRRVSVVIAPLFAGGGMRIKVLEAMALEKPIVATTIGAGGLAVQHERDILIADDAPSFADSVVRLLREPETARRIGVAARANVAERYDNRALTRGLLRFYEAL